MRIACPNCAAVYDVPDQALVRPRVLRCARCGHEWDSPPLPPEAAPPPIEPENLRAPPRTQAPRIAAPRMDALPFNVMDIPPRPAAARQQFRLGLGAPMLEAGDLGRGRPFGARALGAGAFGDRPFGVVAGIVGWVLTAAVLATVVALALLRQPQIEALWPPSQRLYGLLGLH